MPVPGRRVNWFGIVAVGIGVGFVAGLFGKGGSAIATPLLHLFGVPAIVAVAAPLPATIPSTLAATAAYSKERLVDGRLLLWSIACGVPATIVGALATRWIGGAVLVRVTDVVVAGLGLRFALFPGDDVARQRPSSAYRLRLVVVAVVVGLAAGLLANSGGFLLAPLYVAVLGRRVKAAFATSLAVSAVLAVPGTIVHAALGHIDWSVVAVFGAAAVPLSYIGARVALRCRSRQLERLYGVGMLVLGVGLLVSR